MQKEHHINLRKRNLQLRHTDHAIGVKNNVLRSIDSNLYEGKLHKTIQQTFFGVTALFVCHPKVLCCHIKIFGNSQVCNFLFHRGSIANILCFCQQKHKFFLVSPNMGVLGEPKCRCSYRNLKRLQHNIRRLHRSIRRLHHKLHQNNRAIGMSNLYNQPDTLPEIVLENIPRPTIGHFDKCVQKVIPHFFVRFLPQFLVPLLVQLFGQTFEWLLSGLF